MRVQQSNLVFTNDSFLGSDRHDYQQKFNNLNKKFGEGERTQVTCTTREDEYWNKVDEQMKSIENRLNKQKNLNNQLLQTQDQIIKQVVQFLFATNQDISDDQRFQLQQKLFTYLQTFDQSAVQQQITNHTEQSIFTQDSNNLKTKKKQNVQIQFKLYDNRNKENQDNSNTNAQKFQQQQHLNDQIHQLNQTIQKQQESTQLEREKVLQLEWQLKSESERFQGELERVSLELREQQRINIQLEKEKNKKSSKIIKVERNKESNNQPIEQDNSDSVMQMLCLQSQSIEQLLQSN